MEKLDETMKALIESILPHGSEAIKSGGNTYEVNGLPLEAIPVNCKILANKMGYTRIFYLVESNDYALYLRICDALPGCGYAKFAVVHDWIAKTDKEYTNFINRITKKMMEVL